MTEFEVEVLERLDALLEVAPWVVVGALMAGIIGGLQSLWLLLRGKDARRFW